MLRQSLKQFLVLIFVERLLDTIFDLLLILLDPFGDVLDDGGEDKFEGENEVHEGKGNHVEEVVRPVSQACHFVRSEHNNVGRNDNAKI